VKGIPLLILQIFWPRDWKCHFEKNAFKV